MLYSQKQRHSCLHIFVFSSLELFPWFGLFSSDWERPFCVLTWHHHQKQIQVPEEIVWCERTLNILRINSNNRTESQAGPHWSFKLNKIPAGRIQNIQKVPVFSSSSPIRETPANKQPLRSIWNPHSPLPPSCFLLNEKEMQLTNQEKRGVAVRWKRSEERR